MLFKLTKHLSHLKRVLAIHELWIITNEQRTVSAQAHSLNESKSIDLILYKQKSWVQLYWLGCSTSPIHRRCPATERLRNLLGYFTGGPDSIPIGPHRNSGLHRKHLFDVEHSADARSTQVESLQSSQPQAVLQLMPPQSLGLQTHVTETGENLWNNQLL